MRLKSRIRRLWSRPLEALRGAIAWTGSGRVRKFSPIGEARHFAVVCVYEKDARQDLKALIAALRQAGVYCVVTSTNGMGRNYTELADAEIVAPRKGRDFTAYKAGFRFLRRHATLKADSTIAFFNDSVWYFEKYHGALVQRLLQSASVGELFAGSMTIDEIPHVSGWLFGMPFTDKWLPSLDKLFEPHFISDSRMYHVRRGEHRILPEMKRAKGLTLMQSTGSNPSVAACYSALIEGGMCFYLKGDAQLRTNPQFTQLETFLDRNASDGEALPVLQWLTRRSAALYADRGRRTEMTNYRNHYFGSRWPAAKEVAEQAPREPEASAPAPVRDEAAPHDNVADINSARRLP